MCVCVCGHRDGGDDADSQGDGSSQPDTISIASRTSQNTMDSDKVGELGFSEVRLASLLHLEMEIGKDLT